MPVRRRFISENIWKNLHKCLALHIDIRPSVAHGGIEACMPKPMADRCEVDAGLEQINSRRVTKRMRVNPLFGKRRHGLASQSQILPKEVSYAETR